MTRMFCVLLAVTGCGDAVSPAVLQPPPDAGLPDAGPPDAGPLRVFFVGNSYTQVNDLPSVVAALGAPLQVESSLIGGARLIDHWSARQRLTDGGFDAVVIQGQSLEPILWPDDFYRGASMLADAARTGGTRALWLATWARRAGDPLYTDPTFGPRTPEEMTERLDGRYRLVQELFGGEVADVGTLWQWFGPELYADDGSHPSAQGTLLTACALVPKLTGSSARLPDPPPLGLTPETARALCDLANAIDCAYVSGGARCSGACVAVDFDAENCGGCGVRCAPGATCQLGRCQ